MLLDRAQVLVREGAEAVIGADANTWPHPGAMPVLGATHFIAAAPLNHLPHSRVLSARAGRPGTEYEDVRLGPSKMFKDVYVEGRAAPRVSVDYVYDVYCRQEARGDNPYHWDSAWQVEVRRRTLIINPCGEALQDGVPVDQVYHVVYARRPLPDLLVLIQRLGSLTELGGAPEDY